MHAHELHALFPTTVPYIKITVMLPMFLVSGFPLGFPYRLHVALVRVTLDMWQCLLNYFGRQTNSDSAKISSQIPENGFPRSSNCSTRLWGRPPAGRPHGPHGPKGSMGPAHMGRMGSMGPMGPWAPWAPWDVRAHGSQGSQGPHGFIYIVFFSFVY